MNLSSISPSQAVLAGLAMILLSGLAAAMVFNAVPATNATLVGAAIGALATAVTVAAGGAKPQQPNTTATSTITTTAPQTQEPTQ